MDVLGLEPPLTARYRPAVSHFSDKLQELLDKNKLSQRSCARAAELSFAWISRLVRGEMHPSREDLPKIVKAFTVNRIQQAELYREYAFDCFNGPGAELLDIVIDSDRAQSPLWVGDVKKLSPDGQKAFRKLLNRCVEKPALEAAIIAFADGVA